MMAKSETTVKGTQNTALDVVYNKLIEPKGKPKDKTKPKFLISYEELQGRMELGSIHAVVTFVQKPLYENDTSTKYDRYEFNYEEDRGFDEYRDLCRFLKKVPQKGSNSVCYKQDDLILTFLFDKLKTSIQSEGLNTAEIDERKIVIKNELTVYLDELQDENKKRSEEQQKIKVLHKNGYFMLEYYCPYTKYMEYAIPFSFFGKCEFVVFCGQHIIDGDHADKVTKNIKDICECVKAFTEDECQICKKECLDLKQELSKLESRNDALEFLKNKDNNNNSKSINQEVLNEIIDKICGNLSKVKEVLVDKYIQNIKQLFQEADSEAYDTFITNYKPEKLTKENLISSGQKNMKTLAKVASDGLYKLAQIAHIRFFMQCYADIKALNNDKPNIEFFLISAEENPGSIEINENGFPCDKDNDRLYYYPENGGTEDYLLVFAVDFSNLVPDVNDTLMSRDKIIRKLRDELKRILTSYHSYVKAQGLAIIANYNMLRLERFLQSNRHEISQQTSMMEQYFKYSNIEDKKPKDSSASTFQSDIVTDEEFIKNTVTLVRSIEKFVESSRYLTEVVEPDKKAFFPYSEFLYKWIDVFRQECKSRHISLTCDPLKGSGDLRHPPMFADPHQIEQVVYNLTGNALKYSYENTRIMIDFSLDDSGKWYEFKVTNYADTIPLDKQEDLFRYGNQGDKMSKHGMGIGLYIAKVIAEKHEGFLEIDPCAAETISNYNLPLLSMIYNIPEVFLPGGRKVKLIPPEWRTQEKIDGAKQEWENWLEKFKTGKEAPNTLFSDTVLKRVLSQLNHPMDTLSFRLGKHVDLSNIQLEQWWRSNFYPEIDKPTAKIVFTLRIPNRKGD
jgi:signal transduction histidine kinase